MKKEKTSKVVVSLMNDKMVELRLKAEKAGVTLPTYCRIKLSRKDPEEKEQEA